MGSFQVWRRLAEILTIWKNTNMRNVSVVPIINGWNTAVSLTDADLQTTKECRDNVCYELKYIAQSR